MKKEFSRLDANQHNCLFCCWTPVTESSLSNDIAFRIIDIQEKYFAILDIAPKIMGHTLVISQKHFKDITDNKMPSSERRKFALDVFDGVLKVSEWLKENLGAEKVYVITMCEHWDKSQLRRGQLTNEHLHFHLISQYEKKAHQERIHSRRGTCSKKGDRD